MTNTGPYPGNGEKTTKGGQGGKPPITVGFVLDVLRRWWKITVPVGLLLAAAAATGVYLTFVPLYEARALLWIDSRQPYLVQEERYGNGREFAQNQLGLIRSSLVLGPVVSQPEIAHLPELQRKTPLGNREQPTATLASLLDVSQAWGTEHYYIKCKTPNPQSSAAIVNAVAQSYFTLVDEYVAGRTKRLIELLERERDASQREVERLRENVRQMTIDQTGKDPFVTQTGPAPSPAHPLAALESQITSTRVEQAVFEAQITALEEYIKENPVQVSDETVERMLGQNPEVLRQEAVIAEKKARLLDMKSKSAQGGKSILCVNLENEIRRDEEVLAGLRDDLREQLKGELLASFTRQRDEKLTELKARLQEYTIRESALTSAYQEELKQVKQVTGETLDLEIKRAELARADDVLSRIAQRAFLLRTEQRAPSRVELLESATAPVYPVESIPFKQLSVAGTGAFLLPFLLALLWEIRCRRLSSAEQLEEFGQLPVIGEIAAFPSRSYGRRSRPDRINRQLRPFEESVENLRTCLLLSKPAHPVQVLAISSACSQEGKTTVAVQLALSIARSSNEPTLLIDGDTRSPDVHQVFGMENEAGLVDVLADGRPLEEVVVRTWHEALDILPAGKLRGNPHRLFANGALQSALNDACQHYQHVVLDTPPVLAASEALVMASATDATIMCVMRDRSRRDQVRKAYQRLSSGGATLVGSVLNGIPLRRYTYAYGRYDYAVEKAGE